MYREDYDDYCVSSSEADKRAYLSSRANAVRDEKVTELRLQFGLNDDDKPTTIDEFIARIKGGKFVRTDEKINGTKKEFWCVSDMVRYIRWRDPAKVEDKAGYDVAITALDKEYTKLVDQVRIADPATALTALQAFENWSFQA